MSGHGLCLHPCLNTAPLFEVNSLKKSQFALWKRFIYKAVCISAVCSIMTQRRENRMQFIFFFCIFAAECATIVTFAIKVTLKTNVGSLYALK